MTVFSSMEVLLGISPSYRGSLGILQARHSGASLGLPEPTYRTVSAQCLPGEEGPAWLGERFEHLRESRWSGGGAVRDADPKADLYEKAFRAQPVPTPINNLLGHLQLSFSFCRCSFRSLGFSGCLSPRRAVVVRLCQLLHPSLGPKAEVHISCFTFL